MINNVFQIHQYCLLTWIKKENSQFFYLNGQFQSEHFAPSNIFLHDEYYFGSSKFQGIIDEIFIWDTALESEQVEFLYHGVNSTTTFLQQEDQSYSFYYLSTFVFFFCRTTVN